MISLKTDFRFLENNNGLPGKELDQVVRGQNFFLEILVETEVEEGLTSLSLELDYETEFLASLDAEVLSSDESIPQNHPIINEKLEYIRLGEIDETEGQIFLGGAAFLPNDLGEAIATEGEQATFALLEFEALASTDGTLLDFTIPSSDSRGGTDGGLGDGTELISPDQVELENPTLSINPQPPTISSPDPDESFFLLETATNGTEILTVEAEDPEGDDEAITYSLINDNNPFAIDSESGVVTVADSNQLEGNDRFELAVVATDELGVSIQETFIINIDESEPSELIRTGIAVRGWDESLIDLNDVTSDLLPTGVVEQLDAIAQDLDTEVNSLLENSYLAQIAISPSAESVLNALQQAEDGITGDITNLEINEMVPSVV